MVNTSATIERTIAAAETALSPLTPDGDVLLKVVNRPLYSDTQLLLSFLYPARQTGDPKTNLIKAVGAVEAAMAVVTPRIQP